MERKLALVKKHREEYGLNRCLRALSVSKSTWHRHQRRPEVSEKDKELKTKVTEVVEEHPAYGYRRIKVELEESYGTVVNHKWLRRCQREWDLALKRQVARPRPSGVRVILKEGKGKLNLLRNRKPKPLEVLCTDFTEIRYAGGAKKAHLMAMIDPRERLDSGLGGGQERQPGAGLKVLGSC